MESLRLTPKPNKLQLVLVIQCLLSLISLSAAGFQQELWLYLKGGNGLYFDRSVEDTAVYSTLLQNADRYCSRGLWATFEISNFTIGTGTLGSANTSDLFCESLNTTTTTSLGSFRHVAANNTSTDSISLYSEDGYGGVELLVTGRAYGGITHLIQYVAGTGTSSWTLFEGGNLEGKSVCFQVPSTNTSFFNSASPQTDLQLETIGSVMKGCDERMEIRRNKEIDAKY